MDLGRRSRNRSSRRKSSTGDANPKSSKVSRLAQGTADDDVDKTSGDLSAETSAVCGSVAVKEEPNEAVSTPEPNSLPFKNPKFIHSALLDGEKVKRYGFKNLKQILQVETSVSSNATDEERAVLYSQITAPPSMRPELKVSDLSGLPATYVDPKTRLRYATSEEFALTRTMPPEIFAAYLHLRGVPTYAVRS